jgi:hypothetical protein
LEGALNITRRFVPHKATSVVDLEILMIVLTAIAEVAINKAPSAIRRPRLFATAG